jgi:hypothetical protein
MMRATRSSREKREERNDSSCGHLQQPKISVQVRGGDSPRGTTYHSKLAPDLVRQIPKNKHPNDEASKRDARHCGTVVFIFERIRAIDTGEENIHYGSHMLKFKDM